MMKKILTTLVLGIISCQLWALDAPVLTSPCTNYQNAYTRIVLAGQNGANNGYHLQVDTTTRFNSPLLHNETWSKSISSFSSTITDLHFNTHYYWRVRSVTATDTSAWSEIRDFYTNHPVEIEGPNDADETQKYYPTQTLKWKNHLGSGTYVFEIDTVPTFNSPAKVREMWSGTAPTSTGTSSHEVRNLYLGKMIYWRIKLFNSNDSSEWSKTGRFHTLNKAKGKYPDGGTGAYTVQEFKWEYKKGLNDVIIEIDTTETFSSPAKRVEKSSGSNQDYCYTNIYNLYFGTMHYWRVKAYHQKDTTEWSDVLSFKTYRAGSLKTTPADSAVEQPTSPYLYFIYRNGVSKYQMQLDTTPEFNSPALENHIESASSQDYAYGRYHDLLFGTKYYRRVRDCHEKDTSEWSKTWSFTTIVRGAYSTDYSIANGATGIAINPKLYYAYRSYIDSVEIQIDTAEQFNSPLLESIRVQEASSQYYAWEKPKRTLLYGTTYYWRIRNSHSKDVSDWTGTRSFTTIGLSPAPTLVNPENKSIIFCDDSTLFSWNTYSQANGYTLQLSDKSSFDSIWEQVATNDTLAKVKLKKDITYYWRVSAATDLGNSKWSGTRMLSTKDSASLYTLDPPVLTSPNNSITNAYTRQTFKWNSVNGAGKYVLQIDTSRSFAAPKVNDTLTSTTVTRYHFRFGTTYYWRVCALSATSEMELSRWSEVREFTTCVFPSIKSPNNSSIIGQYNPIQNFKWPNNYGSTHYVIEVDTTESFSSPSIKRQTANSYASNETETIEIEIGNLYLGKMNYWRVKAFNNNDSSNWSPVYCFHTLNWAACSLPKDGALSQYTTMYLYWKRINGLPYVIIELDTTATLDSPAKDTLTSWAYYDEDANTQVTQLYFGTQYFWRVRYHHNCDTTDWSPVHAFTTYNSATLSSPVHTAEDRPVTGYVYWKWKNGINYYQVQMDTTEAFEQPLTDTIIWDLENGDHGYKYKNLKYGTDYYWRVRECHPKDTSEWSLVRMFTTEHQLPAPTLVSPKNQTVAYNDSVVKFVWNTLEDATTYIFQLSDDGQFDSYLYQQTGADTTFSIVPPTNSILYWRVKAINSQGKSPWSDVRGVNTTQKPEPRPVIDSPAVYIPNDESATGTHKPKQTFRWEHLKGYTGYIVEIDTVETFTSSAKAAHSYTISSSKTDAYIEKDIDNLYLGCFNYWHVQGICKGDTSNWSVTHKFHTLSKAVATSPNGATNVAIPVTLRWEYQYGLTHTIIEIDTTSDFASPRVFDRDTPNSTWAYQTVSTLKEGTTYYWRMKNCHSKDTTEWSDVLWFTTKTSTPTKLDENVNENVNANVNQARKVLINGQLYIIRDDKRYDATGFTNN